MAYVYRHIRLDKNEPFYIGIGRDESYKRSQDKHKRSTFWKRIANKTEYEVEILFDGLTWDEACEKEKEFIKLYGRKVDGGTLCNLTLGGDGSLGRKPSDLEIEKLRERSVGNQYNLGKKSSENKRRKISEANRKRVYSEETKRKIGEKSKGRINNEKNPKYKGVVSAYKDGVKVGEYFGSGDVSDKLGIPKGGVKMCLAGRAHTSYGYTFKRGAA